MKTTIYELLGMIKDGKAPKKIYYKNEIFEYDEKEKDYAHIDFTEYLFDVYLITDILNDEVEILETTITYKQDDKIKKLEEKTSEIRFAIEHLGIETVLATYSSKINEIIEVLNEIKSN